MAGTGLYPAKAERGVHKPGSGREVAQAFPREPVVELVLLVEPVVVEVEPGVRVIQHRHRLLAGVS